MNELESLKFDIDRVEADLQICREALEKILKHPESRDAADLTVIIATMRKVAREALYGTSYLEDTVARLQAFRKMGEILAPDPGSHGINRDPDRLVKAVEQLKKSELTFKEDPPGGPVDGDPPKEER